MKQATFYIKDSIYQGFRKIADRENCSYSDYLERILSDHITKHGAGNDSYKMDDFDKGLVKAYPTAWKKWTLEDLPRENYSETELEEMAKLLEHNLSLVKSKLVRTSKAECPYCHVALDVVLGSRYASCPVCKRIFEGHPK